MVQSENCLLQLQYFMYIISDLRSGAVLNMISIFLVINNAMGFGFDSISTHVDI